LPTPEGPFKSQFLGFGYPKDRQPGDTFKDCDDCPEMVVVPEGEFRMGDLRDGRSNDEKPVHTVQIGYVLAVGRFEVTYSEWDACLAGGGCGGYLFASSAQEHSQSYRPEVGEGVF